MVLSGAPSRKTMTQMTPLRHLSTAFVEGCSSSGSDASSGHSTAGTRTERYITSSNAKASMFTNLRSSLLLIYIKFLPSPWGKFLQGRKWNLTENLSRIYNFQFYLLFPIAILYLPRMRQVLALLYLRSFVKCADFEL